MFIQSLLPELLLPYWRLVVLLDVSLIQSSDEIAMKLFHSLSAWLLPNQECEIQSTDWRLNLLIASFALERVSFSCCSRERCRDCWSANSFWSRDVSRWFIYNHNSLKIELLSIAELGEIVAVFQDSLSINNHEKRMIHLFLFDIGEQ